MYLSLLVYILVCILSGYWFVLAVASIRQKRFIERPDYGPRHMFAVVIPAHNEEDVIEGTVLQLMHQNYPRDMYNIFVVADYCTDQTASNAKKAGAIVFERDTGLRTGKGIALSWGFAKILDDKHYDAVVVFDADTKVDSNFLRIMDGRIAAGDRVIQGQHVIRNPNSGWFPGLTWAMFLIDNRFQNQGRANLGWSAKHMGDSICFHADVVQETEWSDGLADDYQLRQKFLLSGIKIAYEPEAIGRGEAPLSWSQAWAQRTRWLRGVYDANRQFARKLMVKGIKTRNMAVLDGALQSYVPSYSVLTVVSMAVLVLHWIGYKLGLISSQPMIVAWAVLLGLLIIYPYFGLVLEKAPLKAYLFISTGPLFILWRIWLALVSRFGGKKITWIRTMHKG